MWWEAIGSVGVLLLGGLAASWLGGRPLWWLGYLLPMALVLAIAVARRLELDMTPPFSALMQGRREFLWLGLSTLFLLITPVSRLPRPRDRHAVVFLAVVAAAYVGAYPFFSVALARPRILAMVTRVDHDGVCLQNENYTCGPAAAVTLLRRMGLPAEESLISLAARTSPATGTPLEDLRDALLRLYGKHGLRCELRTFGTPAEMPPDTLAVVKLGLLVDHYVAVLEVEPRQIVVGDPLEGRRTYTHRAFQDRWRGMGLVLSR
ncbi:MAG: cysteine peptidase family C39 domain-containing protein [Candidatus Eremiobacterota bacterium]